MLPPARCRQLPERRLDWVELVLTAPRQCASASSTTASIPTPSAEPSAGSAAWPSDWRPRATRSPTSRCASGRAGRTRASRACTWSRSARAWRSTRRAGGGGSCRRSCSGSASSCTCCGTAAATTSCTPARSPTSRSWPRRLCARSALPAGRRTGSRCGRARTGASTSAASAASIGWRIQRLCLRIPQRAFCLSQLHAERLREEGFRGEVEVRRRPLRGLARAAAGGRRPRRP